MDLIHTSIYLIPDGNNSLFKVKSLAFHYFNITNPLVLQVCLLFVLSGTMLLRKTSWKLWGRCLTIRSWRLNWTTNLCNLILMNEYFIDICIKRVLIIYNFKSGLNLFDFESWINGFWHAGLFSIQTLGHAYLCQIYFMHELLKPNERFLFYYVYFIC